MGMQYLADEAHFMEIWKILTQMQVDALKEEDEESSEEERKNTPPVNKECKECLYWRINGPDPKLFSDGVNYKPCEEEEVKYWECHYWRVNGPDPELFPDGAIYCYHP